jgi:signal recognition particle subunit SRP54
MQAMKKMGPLSKVIDLIPGMGSMNIPKDMLKVQDEKLEKWKHIFNSCTREELENPDVISRSRIDRIAKGAGVSVSDVRELLKMYKQSKKLMKMMSGKGSSSDIGKLMKKFKGKNMKF